MTWRQVHKYEFLTMPIIFDLWLLWSSCLHYKKLWRVLMQPEVAVSFISRNPSEASIRVLSVDVLCPVIRSALVKWRPFQFKIMSFLAIWFLSIKWQYVYLCMYRFNTREISPEFFTQLFDNVHLEATIPGASYRVWQCSSLSCQIQPTSHGRASARGHHRRPLLSQ